jgi:tol-pal system-associated acyl-CoA thioesterase
LEGRFALKVYYEDTDCLGVVYHANYLRFFERGRTEFIAQLGRPVERWNEEGIVLAVYKIEVTFRKAARLGDELLAVSRFEPRPSEYRLVMVQQLFRAADLICKARVQLVCLDRQLAVRALPQEMLDLSPLAEKEAR